MGVFKEYKIWRFTYHCEESTVFLPEDIKMYCENKESSLRRFEQDKVDTFYKPNTIKYPNQHWIGLYPYSDEVWEECKHGVGLSMRAFNLCNEWIIFDAEQICPLTEDWPETETPVKLPHPYYVKLRALKIEHHVDDIVNRINELNSLSLDDVKIESLLADDFTPVSRYIKIHDVAGCSAFDCTIVNMVNMLDGDPMYSIIRRPIEFKDVLEAFHWEKTVFTTSDEWEYAFNEKVQQMFD